jgi:hypothetical protein
MEICRSIAPYQYTISWYRPLAPKGVTNSIVGDDGRRYKLPPAEYTYSGSESVTQVRDAVYQVAASVMPNPAVVVTQRIACAWKGLPQA